MARKIAKSGLRWDPEITKLTAVSELISKSLVAEVSFLNTDKKRRKGKKKPDRYSEQELAEILEIEVQGPKALHIKVHLVDKKNNESDVAFTIKARLNDPRRKSDHLAIQAQAHELKYEGKPKLSPRSDFLCRRVAFSVIEAHLRLQNDLVTS